MEGDLEKGERRPTETADDGDDSLEIRPPPVPVSKKHKRKHKHKKSRHDDKKRSRTVTIEKPHHREHSHRRKDHSTSRTREHSHRRTQQQPADKPLKTHHLKTELRKEADERMRKMILTEKIAFQQRSKSSGAHDSHKRARSPDPPPPRWSSSNSRKRPERAERREKHSRRERRDRNPPIPKREEGEIVEEERTPSPAFRDTYIMKKMQEELTRSSSFNRLSGADATVTMDTASAIAEVEAELGRISEAENPPEGSSKNEDAPKQNGAPPISSETWVEKGKERIDSGDEEEERRVVSVQPKQAAASTSSAIAKPEEAEAASESSEDETSSDESSDDDDDDDTTEEEEDGEEEGGGGGGGEEKQGGNDDEDVQMIGDGDDDKEDDADGIAGDDKDAHDDDESSPEVVENDYSHLPIYLPGLSGCRNVEEFKCLNKIEEGTYGVVYRALEKKTSEIVALKRLKMEKEKEGFPITSLREINTLLKSQHENVVHVREIVIGSNMDRIYLVMDFVEHDLKSLMETMKNPFLQGEVKTLMCQLLRGINHLHNNWILHRDIKSSNLLLSHQGILRIGDFGLAREYGSPLKPYTGIVVTLWYRSVELLLGVKQYSTAVDMWSVGAIFAELLLMKPLWAGKSEVDQLNRIFKDLGTPNEKLWPGCMDLPGWRKISMESQRFKYNMLRERITGHMLTDKGFHLLCRLLTFDPRHRITAADSLVHDYFSEPPAPIPTEMFPTWPARSEQQRRRGGTPKPPSGGRGAYAKLLGVDDDELTRGFQIPVGPAQHGFQIH